MTSLIDGGDITIATILSHTIFSHNDRHKGRHFLITVDIFDIGGHFNWQVQTV